MDTISEIEAWISNYRSTVAKCNDKIDQLEPVYKRLKELKSSFRDVMKATEKTFEEKGNWRGEKYDTFCRAGESFYCTCEEYYEQIDTAMDNINTKIGELEGEKDRLIPLIGNLSARVEELKVSVENYFN